MIDPRNGQMALEKPKIKLMTKGGIRKTDKMLEEELWQIGRVFKVVAIDPHNGMGILAGDSVYLHPDNITQAIELKIDGKVLLMISVFAILGIASKVSRKHIPNIDPDLEGAEPMVHDEVSGKNTLIMGVEGEA